MRKDNKIIALHQDAPLPCGGICLKCFFEDNCPMSQKYTPVVNVDSYRDDGTMIVRCSCFCPKRKTNEN